MAFGPDGDLYVSGVDSDNVIRFDGTTGDYKEVYVMRAAAGQRDIVWSNL